MLYEIHCRLIVRIKLGNEVCYGKFVTDVVALLPEGTKVSVPGAPCQLQVSENVANVDGRGSISLVTRAQAFVRASVQDARRYRSHLLAAGWIIFDGEWKTLSKVSPSYAPRSKGQTDE